MHVFAGLLFQILDDGRARKLERRTKRKTDCAQNAEAQSRAQDYPIGSGQPDDIHRQNFAKRGDEQVGRPKAEKQSANSAEEREEKSFGKKLPHDAAAAAAERETDGDLFAPR